MNQTRIGSLIEAVFNTAIGLGVSLVANAIVFPLFGFHPSLGENVAISSIYTAISIARSYLVRRFFNAKLHAAAMHLAGASIDPAKDPKTVAALGCDGCIDVARALKRGEVTLSCIRCGKRWMNARYVVRPTTDETRTK